VRAFGYFEGKRRDRQHGEPAGLVHQYPGRFPIGDLEKRPVRAGPSGSRQPYFLIAF
jgi:hypothetical protein